MTKQEQRKLCKANVQALSPLQKQEYSKSVVEKLQPFIKDKVVCSYMATENEVNLSAIENACYPTCLDEENMKAYKTTVFKKNKFNILEPDPEQSQEIEDMDVILVPLVGFDENCNRLGHGKGYYDRFLANKKALKIGIGFEAQKLDEVVTEPTDIKLDYIVTETNIYKKAN